MLAAIISTGYVLADAISTSNAKLIADAITCQTKPSDAKKVSKAIKASVTGNYFGDEGRPYMYKLKSPIDVNGIATGELYVLIDGGDQGVYTTVYGFADQGVEGIKKATTLPKQLKTTANTAKNYEAVYDAKKASARFVIQQNNKTSEVSGNLEASGAKNISKKAYYFGCSVGG